MTTLAIDIGGTKIAAAVCDENDSIIQRWRVPTPMDADAINQHIAEVYREAVAAGHTDIEAIGISAAGNVSADRKTLTFSANIPAWINYDLSEHVGRDTAVERHVLALEGSHAQAVLRKHTAQPRRKQALPRVRHGALDHDGLCPTHGYRPPSPSLGHPRPP